jgi:transposase
MTNELLPPSISADDWDSTPPVVRTIVLELLKTNKHLESQLLDLKAQVNQNSQNSSRPPSSDPPNTPPKPPRTPRGKPRSRGGQPGHEGQTRDLVPPD